MLKMRKNVIVHIIYFKNKLNVAIFFKKISIFTILKLQIVKNNKTIHLIIISTFVIELLPMGGNCTLPVSDSIDTFKI